MAGAPSPGGPADPGNDFKNLCRFRELFKGRFSEEEAVVLLQKHNGQVGVTVQFVLSSSSAEVRALLDEEQNSWTIYKSIKSLRKDRRDVLARARSGKIDTTSRQFACGPCDNMWWGRCPERKLVYKCKKCRKKYDPLPRNKEWGWAEFNCPHDNCGNVFSGFCQMGTSSPCFRCGKPAFPTRIRPPSERGPQVGPRHKHRCNGRNCGGRPGGEGAECVHPTTRRLLGLPLVVTPSSNHDSTGSTVDTFLSQTDLTKEQEEFYPALPSIPENWGEDDGDDGQGSDG